MTQFTRALGAALGVVILGSIITLIPQKTALGQNGNNQPVIVKNTPLPITVTNTPLPVTGTVGVSSLPPITLSGTSSVQVANTAASPVLNRDIDRPANQPFNVELCTNGVPGVSATPEPCYFGGESFLQSITIPSTTSSGQTVQRLVIEYASGACGDISAANIDTAVLSAGTSLNSVTGAASFVDHFFPLTFFNGPLPAVQWAEPVHMYADPGTFLVFTVGGNYPLAGCSMSVSGYLAVI